MQVCMIGINMYSWVECREVHGSVETMPSDIFERLSALKALYILAHLHPNDTAMLYRL